MNKARAEYDAKLSRGKKYQLFLEQNPESAQTIAKLGGVDALASMNEKDAAEAFARIEGEVDVKGQLEWMEKSGMWSEQEIGAFSTAKDTQELGWQVAMTQQKKQQKREQTGVDLKEYETMFASAQKTLANMVANPPTNLGPRGLKDWYSDRYNQAMQTVSAQFRGANPDNPYLNNSIDADGAQVQGLLANFQTFATNHMNGQVMSSKQTSAKALTGSSVDDLYTAYHKDEEAGSVDQQNAGEAIANSGPHADNVRRLSQAKLALEQMAAKPEGEFNAD